MKAIISFSELKELLKSDKGMKAVLLIGAALILVIALSGLFSGSSQKKDSAGTTDLTGYEAALEKRLEDILSDIEGIGSVRAMVTLDTAGTTKYGRSSDMIESVTAPKVRGVIVVCDGGDSIIIKEKVINAVTGVFGISTAHVSVSR